MLSSFSHIQLCVTLWTLCSLLGSSVHGIIQAGILDWVAMPFSRGIFLTQWLNLHLLCLLHWQVGSLPLAPPGKPYNLIVLLFFFGCTGSSAHGLSCPKVCGILSPWPGIEPLFLALEGQYLTTGPLGKSLVISVFLATLHGILVLWPGIEPGLTRQRRHWFLITGLSGNSL